MGNLIISDNKIKTRRYNLVIDGKTVEEYLSPRMANILANEYREEGFAVDKIEIFSVTNGIEIVGENPVQSKPEVIVRKEFNTPAATKAKVSRDRVKSRTRAELIAAKNNRSKKATYRQSYGRERESTLHPMYLANLRKNGYRVYNRHTDQVWIGLQKEIAERIFNYINNGGKKSDLDIKFLGA